MTSHELAAILLANPDLPVATHAHNSTYMSGTDGKSHGRLKVGLLHTRGGDHIVIGDISKMNINKPNWYVKEMIVGKSPQEWGEIPEGGW